VSPRKRASRGADRRRDMAAYLMRTRSVAVTELAERFNVSLMTVHRDLDELERQGIVRKFRGGVTAQPSSVFESNISYRLAANTREKEALARHAIGLVEPGMSIMLDDSTTALALARLLPDVGPLTVVTNFLEIIKLLSAEPGIRLIALGGEYNQMHDSFLGVACVDATESMRTDLVFVSTSAISDRDAFHQEQEIVIVKRAMLRSGRRRVLLVDHTKLTRAALHHVAPLTDFDQVAVDEGAPRDALDALRKRNVPLEVVALDAPRLKTG
jgi:DeoR/GlpR family transcriptional regulator of sugar metabolism